MITTEPKRDHERTTALTSGAGCGTVSAWHSRWPVAPAAPPPRTRFDAAKRAELTRSRGEVIYVREVTIEGEAGGPAQWLAARWGSCSAAWPAAVEVVAWRGWAARWGGPRPETPLNAVSPRVTGLETYRRTRGRRSDRRDPGRRRSVPRGGFGACAPAKRRRRSGDAMMP